MWFYKKCNICSERIKEGYCACFWKKREIEKEKMERLFPIGSFVETDISRGIVRDYWTLPDDYNQWTIVVFEIDTFRIVLCHQSQLKLFTGDIREFKNQAQKAYREIEIA